MHSQYCTAISRTSLSQTETLFRWNTKSSVPSASPEPPPFYFPSPGTDSGASCRWSHTVCPFVTGSFTEPRVPKGYPCAACVRMPFLLRLRNIPCSFTDEHAGSCHAGCCEHGGHISAGVCLLRDDARKGDGWTTRSYWFPQQPHHFTFPLAGHRVLLSPHPRHHLFSLPPSVPP